MSDDTGHTWQMNPAIGMSGNGDFVIAWEDSRDGKPDIYAQRYDASGFAEGNNFKLNYDTVATPYYPAIAMNGSGNFVIAWRDRRNTIAAIYAQRYNYRGIPQGPNFKVNDDSGSAMDAPPSVAMDGSGRFIIAWQDYRHSSPDIYAQKYTSSGSPWGGNFLVPDLKYASSVQLFPKVAANSSKIFFTWGDNRRDQTGDIYAKIADWSWTDVKDEQIVGLPKSFELGQNYPNPFNPTTAISFQVGGSQFMAHSAISTTLKIYNILGQKVRTLVDGEKLPGNYKVIWDGKDDSGKEVASGIYFYQLKTRDYTETRKMILLR